MSIAPFIKPIQTNKGIFYTFQSGIEDINLTFSNGSNKTRFSKFALLRIPEIGTPDTLATDNKIQWQALGESPLIEGLNPSQNINLTQSFQNYALNLETIITSLDTYERETKRNVSERVFWKWLKEIGAIRFRESTSLEKDPLVNAKRFTEEDETLSTYNKVVKYIGDIDIVNSVRNNNNSYSEIYIHIPSNVGTTPYVLFDSIKDVNYYPSMVINNDPADPLDEEYLTGRHYTDTHPYALSILGYFDKDDNSVSTQISNTLTTNSLTPGNWFTGNINNAYYTDYNLVNSVAEFNVPTNNLVRKTKGISQVTYVRNSLDGITLDFDLANYKLATQNPEIKTLSHLNDYVGNKNFEFNAILVYYDVYDPSSIDTNGNYTDLVTNLYGILFLDKVEQSGLEYIIPTIEKSKPDPISKTNGNAFAYKINVKFDNSIEDSTVERSINDYNTLSLDLYLDVLTEFSKTRVIMNDKIVEFEQLKQKLEKAIDALVNTENLNVIKYKLSVLENSLSQNNAIFSNTNDIMKLIESVNKRIDDVYNEKTSIQITYNLDAIKFNDGLNSQRKANRLYVTNSNQGFNIENNSIFNLNDVINSNATLTLGKFSNYFRHENSSIPIILNNDLQIKIDDTIGWQKGQTLELVFEDEIDLGPYDIKVYTDVKNKLGQANQYSKQLAYLTSMEFGENRNPIFRIICLNPTTLEFRVDKIR